MEAKEKDQDLLIDNRSSAANSKPFLQSLKLASKRSGSNISMGNDQIGQ